MIIREYFKCSTCDQVHMVRIAIGANGDQKHRFECRDCGEVLKISFQVGPGEISNEILENIERCEEMPDVPVVNLDPNFTLPEGMVAEDFSFARIDHMREMLSKMNRTDPVFETISSKETSRKIAAEDPAAEWRAFMKSLRLERRKKTKLSNRLISDWSEYLYQDEKLAGVEDWAFRIAQKLVSPAFNKRFSAAVSEAKRILDGEKKENFFNYYTEDLAGQRAGDAINLAAEFFSHFSEFSQVLYTARLGVEQKKGHVATSVDFNSVRGFYGDTFEVLSRQVEILTVLNNIDKGRAADQLEKVTLEQYRKFDNASKYAAFESNGSFSKLCEERDNQLRNASHHRNISVSDDLKSVVYRTGKGGTGEEKSISYAEYLHKCYSAFAQVMCIFSLEILINISGNRRFVL